MDAVVDPSDLGSLQMQSYAADLSQGPSMVAISPHPQAHAPNMLQAHAHQAQHNQQQWGSAPPYIQWGGNS